MGTFANATSEIARLKKIAGVSAMRDGITASTSVGNLDNMVLVKDNRISDEHALPAYFSDGAPDEVKAPSGWMRMLSGAVDSGGYFATNNI